MLFLDAEIMPPDIGHKALMPYITLNVAVELLQCESDAMHSKCRESLDLARNTSDTPLRVFKAAAMEESRRNQANREAEQMLERFKE